MALEPLHGLRVVDLYAGSGALGIEALSRGAGRVDFVESNRAALKALAGNLATLGIGDEARVWPLVLPRGLGRLEATLADCDLVLADPPYGGGPAREILAALGAESRLRDEARVVLEHHAKDEPPSRAGRLVRVRERRYGETVVSTYRASSEEAEAEESAS